MISSFRNFAKTRLAGVLVFIMIIPFVFWGMGSMFNTGNTNNIAKIDNTNISTQDAVPELTRVQEKDGLSVSEDINKRADMLKKPMSQKNRNPQLGLFVILTSLFIAALVTCNLIANKFVTVDLGFKVFIVSAGILPYPFTFLVTDLISELYGQKKANLVVFAGFIASMFVLLFFTFSNIESSLAGPK